MNTNQNTEIERKFLLTKESIPQSLDKYRRQDIIQGYVTHNGDTTVRLRKKDQTIYLTIKSGKGIKRTEYETMIPKKAFDDLWASTENRRVEKIRYEINGKEDLIYELDIYKGELKGLLTIEVEFTNIQEAKNFIPPEWFGADVSDQKEYSNSSLSKFGLPKT